MSKICEKRWFSRWQYPAYESSFKPKKFWTQSVNYQLRYLQCAIQECDLLTIATKYHGHFAYTDQPGTTCLKHKLYPLELEERFEKAVWKILSKEYKISFDRFIKSLRLNLSPFDPEYSAPLLMHFTNYLVPKYEFHYKTADDRMKNIPYKTLKFPSEFEVAIGIPNVGKVVYEYMKRKNNYI